MQSKILRRLAGLAETTGWLPHDHRGIWIDPNTGHQWQWNQDMQDYLPIRTDKNHGPNLDDLGSRIKKAKTTFTERGESMTNEKKMSASDLRQREKIVLGMKKNKADLKKRYGDRWQDVMYATATKQALEDSMEESRNQQVRDRTFTKMVEPLKTKQWLKDMGKKKDDKEKENEMQEGYYEMPRVDLPDEIPGMEGPWQMRSGRIVYYDPREGKYYDRSTDMYLSDQEAHEMQYPDLYREFAEFMGRPITEEPGSEWKQMKAFQVAIPANVYSGKYYDYRVYPYHVIQGQDGVETPEDAVQWVLNNQDKVLDKFQKARYNGRRIIMNPASKNVFFDKINPRMVKLIDITRKVSTQAESLNQNAVEEEKKGLYYYVNKRKKAGTSRPKGHPKAPSDQDWKNAAKTAKESVSFMEEDPCWDGYEQVGMKTKNGKRVPNCVPKEGIEEGYPDNYRDPYAGEPSDREVDTAYDFAADMMKDFLRTSMAQATMQDLRDPGLDPEDREGLTQDLMSDLIGTGRNAVENEYGWEPDYDILQREAKSLIQELLSINETQYERIRKLAGI